MSEALQALRERFPGQIVAGVALPGHPAESASSRRWALAALRGRLTELSATGGAGPLTRAVALVREAQAAAEPVAWLMSTAGGFYPPDAAANGVELATLAVVRVPDATAVGRAAAHLARSGAFGLLVLDLGLDAALPAALQGRLVQQAQRHDSAILCLTEKPAAHPSLGSLVALRAHATRRRVAPDRFACRLEVTKDKRRGPGWAAEDVHHGPPGLR